MAKFEKTYGEYRADVPLWKMYGSDGRIMHPKLRYNPIYYTNHFQYLGGSLLRQILGREIIWDREVEDQIIGQMDQQYHEMMDLGTYDLQCFRCVAPGMVNVRGTIWSNGVKPKYINMVSAKYEGVIAKDDCIYLRTFSDHHDLEFFDHRSGKEIILTLVNSAWSIIRGGFKKLRSDKIYKLKKETTNGPSETK